MTGLFVQVSIRKGAGPDAKLVSYGVADLRDIYALEQECERALAGLRRELAEKQLAAVIEGRA